MDKDAMFIDPTMLDGFPMNHPALEQSNFPLHERFAYPVILWFLDSDRNRATGRSYLLARAILELCMRGRVINIRDITTQLTLGDDHRKDQILFQQVIDLSKKIMPTQLFEFNHTIKTITYKGRRPKF